MSDGEVMSDGDCPFISEWMDEIDDEIGWMDEVDAETARDD